MAIITKFVHETDREGKPVNNKTRKEARYFFTDEGALQFATGDEHDTQIINLPPEMQRQLVEIITQHKK